jgi:hypothetical protein
VSAKVLLLLIGIIAGGVAGWLTRPATVELQIGPLNIAIQGNEPAGAQGGRITSEQWRHIAILTGVGAAIGLALGFALDRGRIT